TFTGSYRTGDPYDVVTVSPAGGGGTFAGGGIPISVRMRGCTGAPMVGSPRGLSQAFTTRLCPFPRGNLPRTPAGSNGSTQFTGTLQAGGCVENVENVWVFVDGVSVGALPIRFNSPDTASASPCFVDAGDLGALATKLGTHVGQAGYSICFDYNEDG